MRIRILGNIYNYTDMVLRKKLTYSILVIALLLIVLPSINGCLYQSWEEERLSKFSKSLSRANSGDGSEAFDVAQVYDESEKFRYLTGVEEDRTKAIHYYKVAADTGHKEALEKLFDCYYFGILTPENKAEANRYLAQAAELGHEWAMLLLAQWSEDNDPEKALNLYLQAARKDNSCAQGRLTEIYFEGKIIPQDICKSYFWGLLEKVGSSWEHHRKLFNKSRAHLIRIKAELALDSDQVQLVQDAASRWQKGQSEPDLPLVQIEREKQPSLAQIIPLDKIELTKLESKV